MSPATWGIILAVLGSAPVGVIVAKYFRPNATPLEIINEIQEERKTEREERQVDRELIGKLQQNQRDLSDYVHLLRDHIAKGQPPPPPPWPEGLRR